MKDEKPYVTSDLWQASALVALGYLVEKVDRSSSRISFQFQDAPGLHQNVAEYQNDSLLIQVQRLRDSFKYIKSLIYGN